MVLLHALVGAVNHLDGLVQLDSSASVLVNTEVEDEAPLAEDLETRDEVILKGNPMRFVLDEVAEALDLGPGFRPGRLFGLGEVLLELLGS